VADKNTAKKPVKKVINIDEGDNNADWIKRVNGGESQRRELEIHAKLAKGKDAGADKAQDRKPDTEADKKSDTMEDTDEDKEAKTK
jgi:hypothetical protein